MPKISKRTVDAAAPSDRRYIVWDDAIKGFGLLVLPSGVKSYVYNYRNAFGRDRRITIGKHGGDDGAITPEFARGQAKALEERVSKDGDPLAEKKALRDAPKVGGLLDQYLVSEAFNRKAASTQAIDRGRIEHHLRPQLGTVPLLALTMADVERAQRSIRSGKTAIDRPSGKKRGRIRVTGGEGSARMAVRLLRAILSWGLRQKLVSPEIASVAKYVDVGRDGRRTSILKVQGDYAKLFKAIDRLTDPSRIEEGEKLLRMEVADAIRVIALTGARRGEILGLRWEHVDLKAGTVTLPPLAHKTGRKTGDDRIIGLPAVASAIIARQPKGKASDLVFVPSRGGERLDLTKPWRRICKAAELPAELGLHGLRHSLASMMAMSGAGASEIMAALGHRDLATSQKYVHFARDQRQVLAEKAASEITAALIGDEGGKSEADVIAFPG